MEWPEWMDAMHKLGYSDSQIAELLRKRGYKKSAIRKAFGSRDQVPFFHTLFFVDMEDYFSRLDTKDFRPPVALLSVNAAITAAILHLSLPVSPTQSFLASFGFMIAQILCTHAGAKLYDGKGSFRETLFAEAIAISVQFTVVSIGFIVFAFLRNFSSLLAISTLLLILWVASMLSGVLGYIGLEQYHELSFLDSMISAMLLPLIALVTGAGTVFLFALSRWVGGL